MPKNNTMGSPFELANLCAGIVNAQCLSLEINDVMLLLGKIGIDVSRNTVFEALTFASDNHWIGVTVSEHSHWVFYSEEWVYSRKR